PAPRPKADNRQYTIKRGDTLWDLAQKYYGNPYQWTKIAQANKNLDPKRLQVGKKLIIPFDTGGYTGDWVTNEGRLALLHKKELVLNESQTRDILDVAKIVDKISGFIPRISASKPNLGSSSITNTGDNYNLETLVLEIPDFKGDEKDARRVFDNMAKSLKKLGK
ncbi:MAG TPA: LysM peptidoglycan-binding domain-containing protein, partial [Tissierellaceae bacterium]|nr:LysM peptidoglycan-binding domain-containing protein [Tissierellaceae bacterium]